MILFVGTIGILIPGVQPVVLAALLAEQHITLTQLGHAASAELLSMGLAAAFAAAFLPPRRLPAIALITSLVLAAGNWLTPFAVGEMVTAVRALTGFTGGILIWVAACMIARAARPPCCCRAPSWLCQKRATRLPADFRRRWAWRVSSSISC